MNDQKFANTLLINLSIVLIVPFLIWGPFFPDLIVVIVTLFFSYYVIKKKLYYYFNNIPLKIFFLFCVVAVISSIFAKDILFSLKSSIFYFRIGIFTCFIWYLIDKDRIILSYFYYALILCFTVLTIDGYYQYFNGKNLFGFEIVGTRISSFFGDEMIMGSYLSRLFPLLFALFLIKKKKTNEIYFIGLLFILVDILIYLSGERTAFFYLNLSTIFIIILIKDYKKFRLITFTIALFCVFIISLNSSKLTNRMILEPLNDMGFIENSKDVTIFSPTHDSMIKTAFNMFLDKPLLGHGPKMFRKLCSQKKYAVGFPSCSTHPHNFYVQLLAETGIIGVSFLLILFFYIFYCCYKHIKSIIFKQERYLTDYQICLLSCLLITTWPFAPNGNFFNNWLMIVYSLPIGFYLQSIYSRKKSD